MRKLAINFAALVPSNIGINLFLTSENKQIRLGLQRIVNKLEQQTDLVIGELANLFGDEVSNLAPDEISEIIQGTATIDLVSGTSVVAELKTEKYSDLENKLNKIKEENPDSFIGWA